MNCECPLAGFCTRRQKTVSRLHHAKCQAGHVEHIDTLYSTTQPAPSVVSKPVSVGLGDKVKNALTMVGITEERVSNWLGAPCNCTERVEKLNRLGEWASKILKGQTTEPPFQAEHKVSAPRIVKLPAESLAGCIHDGTSQEFLQFVADIPGVKLGVKPPESSHRRILDTTGNSEKLKARIIEWNKGTSRPTYDEPYVIGRWSCSVTTVPQRASTSLSETLEALQAAGFDKLDLYVDSIQPTWSSAFPSNVINVTYRRNIRTYSHWYLTLTEMYMRDPYCQWYAIFQDDFIAVRNLKQYIEQSTAQLPVRHYLNLFTFMENETVASTARGWLPAYCDKNGRQLGRGAVGLVLPHRAVTELLSSRHMIDRRQDSVRGHRSLDGAVVEAMNSAGFKEYIHSPSLLQHTGEQSSMGNPWNTPNRYPFAKTFPGKDTDAMTFL